MITNYNNNNQSDGIYFNDFYDSPCSMQEHPMDGFERLEYIKKDDVNEVRHVKNHAGEDRFDIVSKLPLDLVRIIFFSDKTDLPEIALVSRKWKELAYDKELYHMLYATIEPSQFINEEVWKKHIGKSEKETLLPLCIFKVMENIKGTLTWVTETVEIIDEGGTIRIVPINPETIGELVKTPMKGHPTGYLLDDVWAWPEAIKDSRSQERSHWVWMDEEKIGINWHKDEKVSAQEKGGNVSGLNDTIVQAFMEKVRSGKSCFMIDPINDRSTWIRMKEKTNGCRIMLGFAVGGLMVRDDVGTQENNRVISVSRKSFGR